MMDGSFLAAPTLEKQKGVFMAIQTHLILALLIGLAIVVVLILRTKVQAFPTLLIAAIVVGVIAGLPIPKVMTTISEGFGSTLGSIGIIIGLGVMMGKVLEVTGGAKKMALTILKGVGIARAEWVLAISGLLVSIPVFCDSGYVILSELAKEFSRITKKSMVLLGCSLGIGLFLTHHLVPPTPGPLAVAGLLGVDLGVMILAGIVFSAIMIFPVMAYVHFISKLSPEILPEGTAESTLSEVNLESFDESKLPATKISFAPIVVPIVLILIKTATDAVKFQNDFISLFCNPITAVLIGLLIAVYGLMWSTPREQVVKVLEDSLSDAGLIILITGAGGALGAMLRTTGVGNHVAEIIAASGFPAILVPLLMATLLKLSQGSGTVAMITTASIVAPMMQVLGLHPLTAALSICVGAMCASYFNDSYFWVVTRFSGMDVKTGLKAWTSCTAFAAIVGYVMILLLSMVL